MELLFYWGRAIFSLFYCNGFGICRKERGKWGIVLSRFSSQPVDDTCALERCTKAELGGSAPGHLGTASAREAAFTALRTRQRTRFFDRQLGMYGALPRARVREKQKRNPTENPFPGSDEQPRREMTCSCLGKMRVNPPRPRAPARRHRSAEMGRVSTGGAQEPAGGSHPSPSLRSTTLPPCSSD